MDLSLLADPIFLLQNLVDGLSRGALYGVFAMGFTLIFGVLDILNLAHAATFMWCAFAGWLVMARAGLPLPLGLLAAMAAGAAIALLLELLAFRPLRREARSESGRAKGDKLSAMISSIGASLILVSVAEAVFGVETKRFPSSVLDPRPFFIGGRGGVRISRAQILILAASVVLMVGLGLFIRKTRMGKAIRAVAASQKASRLLGIDVNAVIVITFLVGGALAGAAGILVALLTNNIVPGMGAQIELRGLAVVILGGMGNIEGAVLGGFLLGLVETLTIAYIPGGSDIKDAIAFLILFLILLVKPNGILGRASSERA
jgi:branched-chain amino acid transport system permease protein